MGASTVHVIDLNFQGKSGAIAAYLVEHAEGLALVECGPATTLPALEAGLRAAGFTLDEVTDLLVTHIHLDHAGAAGALAARGLRVHVHERGAPHLADPAKLLASAARIYGDEMDRLWGDVRPVPNEKLIALRDGDLIDIGGLRFRALDTPGHAGHHMAFLLGEVCFSGDVGGVRLPGHRYVDLPLPPPELDLELWAESARRLQGEAPGSIAPTHFGIYPDVAWHFEALREALGEVRSWLSSEMARHPSLDEFRKRYVGWVRQKIRLKGVDPAVLEGMQAVNPAWMSADGLFRYWNKSLRDDRSSA